MRCKKKVTVATVEPLWSQTGTRWWQSELCSMSYLDRTGDQLKPVGQSSSLRQKIHTSYSIWGPHAGIRIETVCKTLSKSSRIKISWICRNWRCLRRCPCLSIQSAARWNESTRALTTEATRAVPSAEPTRALYLLEEKLNIRFPAWYRVPVLKTPLQWLTLCTNSVSSTPFFY